MNLIEMLNEKSSAHEKVAEDVFAAAFADEMCRLGYEVDLEKCAGILSAISGLVKKAPSLELQGMRAVSAARKVRKANTLGFNALQKKTIGRGTLRQAAGKIGKI